MPAWPKIADIAAGVKKGQLKASDLVKQSLTAIEENTEFNTVISTIEKRAFARAAMIDEKAEKGEPVGPLAGVPFIAKDNFLTFGSKTTAASNMLKNFEAPYQATAIERLEEAGAICVAKSNLDAWAHGSSTENSDFFVSKNPYDKTRVPGGSSGGSAAAVALGIVPFALGTDTGGSVRQPASLCGIIGLKPTYGLISRSGIVAMASSTDVVGTLTKYADDSGIVLDAMAGVDPLDSTTVEKEAQGYQISKGEISGKKIGLIKEYIGEGLDSDVRIAIEASTEMLKKSGAVVEEVSLPSLPLALAVYYIVCPAEVSSNLARYDGQRYGHISKSSTDIEESYLLSREEGFGAEAKRRIMIGSHVLSSGYYDAYYKKAQAVRTKIIKEFSSAFDAHDFLIGPTSATTAFKIGEKAEDPLQMYLCDIMTVAANISGNPSISIPTGDSKGLPIGLQVIGPQRADRSLLEFAIAIEENT